MVHYIMSFASIFTQRFYDSINDNVIKQMFPKIPRDEQFLLLAGIIGLLKVMVVYIDHTIAPNSFLNKLQENAYEDTKWLLTLLLPYINTLYKPLSEISNLNDIYTAKLEKTDINYDSPIYLYSNIEYNRCSQGTSYEEIKFEPSHFEQNYYLLINTLVRCFNRLHPNWTTIIPMRQDTFRTTTLYHDTKNKLDKKNFVIFDPVIDFPFKSVYDAPTYTKAIEKIKGLSVEDLYNTISMHIFDNIVSYKWVLYYVGCKFNEKKIIVPTILFLNTYFSDLIMNALVQNINWEKIQSNIHVLFTKKWENLIKALDQNEEFGMLLNEHDLLVTEPHYIKTFVLSIVKFYDKKYANLNLDKTYIPLEKNPDNPKEKPTTAAVIASAKSINIMYLYRFLQKSINEFKYTWFALKLMNKEKTEFIKLNEQNAYYGIAGQNIPITYKNIYNFCKSFSYHVVGKNYIRYPKYWESLNKEAKTDILNRFNGTSTSWFSIVKNIKTLSTFLGNSSPNVSDVNKHIHAFLLSSIVDIVFETLVMTGTMTYLAPSDKFTNKAIYNIANTNQKKQLVNEISKKYFYENSKYLDNAYYYMTSKPFSSTPRYAIAKSSKIYGYAEIVSDPEYAWYLNMAYNWVSQINFCHKFINNRITFVTGATGAGKSTQVPKLHCYFSVAIDYKLNPSVLITCPRVNLVKKNSEFVSYELALPFKTSTNDDTENYQVQYKHMHEKRTKQDNTPKLIFVTDGTFIQDVKNPLLKKITTNSLFHSENLYDTIIVDEAHEHNINMDMILTFMRHITFYNNQLRLVIMSATLDQDEHIYRRYFRKINDNLKYPLNTLIEEYTLDRINVDRRFDIQPPTKNTTMPTITEKTELKLSPEEVVRHIATEHDGNILLFQAGQNDINKSLDILNAPGYLPAEILAIPYYAAMEKSRFPQNMEVAKEIDVRLSEIRIDKAQSFVDSNLLDGNNVYTRYVIVATNIAESGVTYTTLDWVVDTGKEKILEYDVEKRRSMLKEHRITVQSSKQRRGRVGRTKPGTVYYMYDQKTLEKTKLYVIATSDIKFSVLFEFLKLQTDTSAFTTAFEDIVSGNVRNIDVYSAFFSSFLKKYDNTVPISFIQQTVIFMQTHENDPKSTFKKLLKKHMNDSNVSESIANNMDRIVNLWFFIKTNYFANEKLYSYKGDPAMQNYVGKYFCDIFPSGVNIQCLEDETGDFYLIHPNELNIKRNIAGTVIENNNVSKIKSKKIQIFIDELFRQSYITHDKNGQIVKTALGQFVNNVVVKLVEYNIETAYAQTIAICFLLLDINDSNDALHLNDLFNLFSLLSITNSNPLRLSEPTHMDIVTSEKERAAMMRKNFKDFAACLQTDEHDDIDLYINFGRLIDKLIIGRDGGQISHLEYIAANKHNPTIRHLLSRMTDDTSEESQNFRSKIYIQIINDMHVPYMYTRLTAAEYFLNSIHTTVNNLHPNKGNNYLKLREKLRLSYHDILRGNTELFSEAQKKMKIYRQYINKLSINPIKGAFLFNHPHAICKRISITPFFLPIIYPSFDTICMLGQTALSPLYTGDYIMYLHLDESNKVHTIMKINKYFLEVIYHAYKEYKKEPINYDKLTPEQMRIVMAYYTALQNIQEDMAVARVHTDILHVLHRLKN